MDNKRFNRFKRRTLLTTAAVAVAYSAIAGKGLFNKPRFKEQHEALAKYVDNNYPDCTYSEICMHGKGWSSIIRRHGKPVCFVYFSKSPDGVYVFTESATELK